MSIPLVSVVVPNYNHGRFLQQRLRSILDQSFQDYEVIFLDDASTDNSRDIFAGFAGDARIQSEFNRTNSGNVFKQWNRGVRQARGEYVWIAESDDFCEPTLLEMLVNCLRTHLTVGLAYCQSWRCAGDGSRLALCSSSLPASVREHWNKDYVNSGTEECTRYMVRHCFVPNASSVVFRRSVYQAAGGADCSFRVSGDYMMWVKMMLASDVAYVAEPLNYWRRHGDSVSITGFHDGRLLAEAYRVVRFICRHSNVPSDILEVRLNELIDRWLVESQGPLYRIGMAQHLRIALEALLTDPQAFGTIRALASERMKRKGGFWRWISLCVGVGQRR